eukprot:Awhi_evm3s4538
MRGQLFIEDNRKPRLKGIFVHLTDKATGVDIRPHRYFLTTYENTFLGNELTNWLLIMGYAKTSKECIDLGKELIRAMHIVHCCGDHDFKNEGLFYRAVPLRLTSLARELVDINSGVTILTRQYNNSSYVSCFIGKELVDWLLENKKTLGFETRRPEVRY